MNAWRPVLAQARAAVLLMLVVLGLCLIVMVGLRQWQAQEQNELNLVRSSLSAQQDALALRRADAQYLHLHMVDFQRLQLSGLIGRAERASWVEQLVASHQRLALPDTLSYSLQPPQTANVVGLATPLGAAPSSADSDALTAQTHDLEFTLKDVHEGELLDFLADYRRQVKAPLRVNACQLAEPQASGLTARCSLRFFSLQLPAARQ